jgi:predicted ATPase
MDVMSGPFVGRRDALRVLTTAIEATGSGEGRVVVVTGEAGIGKTRLVTEAVAEHPARWASCWQGDGAPAFWPWRQLLASTPELFAAPDEADARFALFDAVAAEVASVVAASPPLVLVIDDLHWADTSSIRLLQFLARDRRCRELVVIATVRLGELEGDRSLQAAIGDLGSLARLVHLEGLDATEVEALARALAGEQTALPPAAMLWRRSGGNPLFVNELVGMVVRSGDPSAVPTGVWAVVGRRLDELSADAVDVLSVAAVIGAEFDLPVLERAAGLASRDVARALEEAIAVQLIRRDRSRPRFAFVHVLVQEVLYERLGLVERRGLHEQVADVLEASGGRVTEIAHHRLRAATGDDDAAAVEWAVRAAEQCFAELAYEDAADWYGRALGGW